MTWEREGKTVFSAPARTAVLVSALYLATAVGQPTAGKLPSAMLLVRRRATQAGLDAPPGGVPGGLVIAGMVTPALGLPPGGILVQALGWQSTFLANVPARPRHLAAAQENTRP